MLNEPQSLLQLPRGRSWRQYAFMPACPLLTVFFFLYRAWSRQSAASSIYRPWVLDPSFTAPPRVCSLALSWRESRCTEITSRNHQAFDFMCAYRTLCGVVGLQIAAGSHEHSNDWKPRKLCQPFGIKILFDYARARARTHTHTHTLIHACMHLNPSLIPQPPQRVYVCFMCVCMCLCVCSVV